MDQRCLRRRDSSSWKLRDRTSRKASGPNRAVRDALIKHEVPKLKKGRGLSSTPGSRRNGVGLWERDVAAVDGALGVTGKSAS